MNKSTIVRVITGVARPLSTVSAPLASRWLARLFTTPVRRTETDREKARMAGARTSRLELEDRRELTLYSWGSGPTVLLVHGWSSSAAQLAVYAKPLVERGFRVVGFDQPGHGRSDGKRTALPDFAVATQAVAESVGPLHAVVAHSLGSAAMTLAISRGVVAERLAYLAPPEDLPGYLGHVGQMLGFTPAVATLAQERLEREFGLSFDHARAAALAPNMTTPLFIAHDHEDPQVVFADGRRIHELWPGSVMLATRGLGHNRLVRDPAVVEAVLDWVSAASRSWSPRRVKPSAAILAGQARPPQLSLSSCSSPCSRSGRVRTCAISPEVSFGGPGVGLNDAGAMAGLGGSGLEFSMGVIGHISNLNHLRHALNMLACAAHVRGASREQSFRLLDLEAWPNYKGPCLIRNSARKDSADA